MEEIRSQVLRLVNETRGEKGVDPGPDLNRLRNKGKLLRTEICDVSAADVFKRVASLAIAP